MNVFKKIWRFVNQRWEPIAGYTIGFGIVGFLLFFKLGTLVPGLSDAELQTLSQSGDWHVILNNPINGPYKLLQLIPAWLDLTSPFAVRSVSALCGLVAVAAFYYILSRWHTPRIALLGTALFATSSWFLYYARLATPETMLPLAVLLSIVYGTWIRYTKRSGWVMVVGVGIAATMLYLPGFVWLVVLGGVWQRKAITKHLRDSKIIGLWFALMLAVGMLSPLGYALVQDPSLLRSFAGLPQQSPIPNIFDYLYNLVLIPVQVFIKSGVQGSQKLLGSVPLVDIFATVMFALGVYAYYYRRKLDRTKMLVGLAVAGSALVALDDGVTTALLLPIVYIVAAAGITLMLQQWFTVFPRNPLARIIGTSLVSVAVITVAFYHSNYYYIAWPNAPETKATFNRRP